MPLFTGFRFQSFLIVMLGASFALILFFVLSTNNKDATERALLQAARTYSQTFTGFRDFYLQTVVQRVADTDVQVVHDFRDHEKAIPIPATMMLELSAYLNSMSTDITFSLVSDYPFPWRKNRYLAGFDRRALDNLRSSGASEYSEVLEENGLIYLHYASPVLMKKGCVDCHNTHPDSPKRDWKVGDIRAVQVFEIPVDDAVRHVDFETSAVAATIAFVGMTTIFALLFLNQRAARAQEMLRREAYYDILTGAMRRQRFQEIYDVQQRQKEYYLVLIDVDDFKSFNTNYGHAVGDVVLARTVSNLRDSMPEAEVICRFGGEEFLLLVPVDKVHIDPDTYFSNAVNYVAKQELSLNDRITHCTISAGYIRLQATDDLIRASEKADTALRYAKRTGKNRAIEADQNLLTRLGYLETNYKLADIASAIERDEFVLFFQPIYDLHLEKAVASEALVRWCRPGHPPIPPASFLPQYVSALRDASLADAVRRMVRSSLPPKDPDDQSTVNLSFNYDPYDLLTNFNDNAMTPVLRELLGEGYAISIEVIETPYLAESSPEQVSETFKRIVDEGFDLYLDDFGKDGSGLERLAVHSFAVVKADRALIAGLAASNRKQQMISLLVEMTNTVGARLIVEGVESAEECALLRSLGVRFVQGYFFGRPRQYSPEPLILRNAGGMPA